jgi:RNA polymerase sigma-70 factor (ECF subfamily)
MLRESSFLTEFLRVERRLLAYLRSVTGDVHAAEDLLQTVASTLWEKRAEYDPTRPFEAWAMGVTHLEVLKWRQRLARSREILSEESMRLLSETASQYADMADQRYDLLAECLKSLRGNARRVMQMKYGEGRKIREIAIALRKSVAAIEMILVRSRRGLRACVERKLEQQGGRLS